MYKDTSGQQTGTFIYIFKKGPRKRRYTTRDTHDTLAAVKPVAGVNDDGCRGRNCLLGCPVRISAVCNKKQKQKLVETHKSASWSRLSHHRAHNWSHRRAHNWSYHYSRRRGNRPIHRRLDDLRPHCPLRHHHSLRDHHWPTRRWLLKPHARLLKAVQHTVTVEVACGFPLARQTFEFL